MPNFLLLALLVALLGIPTVCQAQDEERRQVQKYALPAFSLLLKIHVDEVDADDDDQIYLDLEQFKETLDRVTQLHLTDVFQQADERIDIDFDEQFLRVQLSSKVRQDIMAVEHAEDSNTVHVPLHAGFSGIVSYSFPSKGILPADERMDELIRELLESALVGDNYMLLFRRYLSNGMLADIEDVQDIRIGTQLLNDVETPAPQQSFQDPTQTPNPSSSGKKSKQLNAITIVAIVIFLTLSCLLMLFGATVVLLMNDRNKQEEDIHGRAVRSVNKSSTKDENKDDDNDSDSDEDSTASTKPLWKQAVLPFLRKAIMVRRYWRKHLRKQRRARRKQGKPQATENPNEAAATPAIMEEDDGLNDEDVYYDDGLTDEEAANQWLDAWSQSITSIPLRNITSTRGSSQGHSPGKKHVKKKKTSKMDLAPHPAKRQSKNTFLCCIAEEDSVVDTNSVIEPEDLEASVASTPRGNSNTTKICLELDRIQELASTIMEDEYPSPVVVTSKSFPGAYGQSARKKKLVKELDEDELHRIQDVDLS